MMTLSAWNDDIQYPMQEQDVGAVSSLHSLFQCLFLNRVLKVSSDLQLNIAGKLCHTLVQCWVQFWGWSSISHLCIVGSLAAYLWNRYIKALDMHHKPGVKG